MRLLAIALLLSATACATAPRNVQPFGPGLYTVSYSSMFGSGKSRAAAIRDANKYCKVHKAVMIPESEETSRGSFTLKFRCSPDPD